VGLAPTGKRRLATAHTQSATSFIGEHLERRVGEVEEMLARFSFVRL